MTAVETLKPMANPKRLLLLCHLGEDELRVSCLAEAVDLSQSAFSQYLGKLCELVVSARREQQTIYNRFRSAGSQQSHLNPARSVLRGNRNPKERGGGRRQIAMAAGRGELDSLHG